MKKKKNSRHVMRTPNRWIFFNAFRLSSRSSQYTARQHGSLVPKVKMDQYIVIVYVPKLIIIK